MRLKERKISGKWDGSLFHTMRYENRENVLFSKLKILMEEK